ncbi:MAG: reverse transcriptase family protein, partial [Nitrospinales bacterium]|nr:reverse transcriptase family protein [Nitrospinales bacterium]
QMVEIFTSTFLNLAKTHIPFKIVTISDKDAPWFNNKIKYAIQKNKRLVKNWIKNGKTPADTTNKNKSQRDLHKLITEAKTKYIENLGKKISDPNTGAKIFWSSYKRLINNKKNTNIPPLLVNGSFIANFKEKAMCFNKLFAGYCKTLVNNSILPPSPNPRTNSTLSGVEIHVSEIISIIGKLNPKKAHGIDGISIELIRKCKNEVAIPLKLIFEKCLETGIYPSLWKKANVQPVHKKDSRQIVGNYRPISLLCISGKIFEKIIFDQMYSFFNANNLITEHQSGFRPGDSTINQLTSITHEIFASFEDYDETRALFLDISKAFDKTWHDGLIFKLKGFGISGNLISLLTNYLSDRYQRVVLNGQESDWEKIYAGVPQGSVLGPLLFLVYINDLIDGISSNIKLFADDSSLFTRVMNNVSATHERLSQDLDKITEWAHQWKMRFNPDMAKQAIEVVFSCKYNKTKPTHPPLFFNSIPVARQNSTKHLGLILDERLTFTEHIKEAIEKAKKGVALMKFLANKVSSKVLELTYTMYVRPHLDYGDVIYHNQHTQSMELLEKIQYQAGLVISNCWKGTSRVKLYKELGWESLSQRRVGRRFALYHKILNNHTPMYLKNHIQDFTPRTERFSKSFFPFCAENWPSIPDSLKQAPSPAAFKNAYKKEFIPSKIGYFGIQDKFGVRLLTKIRVDCSDLRDHRFNHGFVNCPSPLCRCGLADETSEHFLTRCPNYSVQRATLLRTASGILHNDISVLPDSHLADLFLFGSRMYNSITNKLLLESTIHYIKSTKRFSKLEAFTRIEDM